MSHARSDRRLARGQRPGGVARLWRFASLAVLLPVLALTGIRAYRTLPAASAATRFVADAIDRELEMPVDMSHATITLRAMPDTETWDVFVDGQPVGQTPLEKVAIAIGPHEIRFHHPVYGDRVHQIVATRSQPLQLAADLP